MIFNWKFSNVSLSGGVKELEGNVSCMLPTRAKNRALEMLQDTLQGVCYTMPHLKNFLQHWHNFCQK